MGKVTCRAVLARIECELAALARHPGKAPDSWRRLEFFIEELSGLFAEPAPARLQRLLGELHELQARDFRQPSFKDQVLLIRASCVTWQRELATLQLAGSTSTAVRLD